MSQWRRTQRGEKEDGVGVGEADDVESVEAEQGV
jgi:hypothetical protein